MNGEELELLIRPIASPDTIIVINIKGKLYDVEWSEERIEIDQPTEDHGIDWNTDQSYYRVILTPKEKS